MYMQTAPKAPVEQSSQLGQKVKFLEQLKVIKADPKRFRILLVMLAIMLLFGVGIVITILEQVQKNKPVKTEEVFEQVEIVKQPGEMVWLFYIDTDKDQVFDHSERVVKDVTVAIRRSGDEEVWRSQPADVNGVVKLTDLPVGEYEVRFLNYEEPEAGASSYFPGFYRYQDQFLPSEWELVSLEKEGYEKKIGLVSYSPKKVVVVQDSLGIRLVDLVTQQDYGWLRNLAGLTMKVDRLLYWGKNQLMEFDLNLKTGIVALTRLYGMEEKEYVVSRDLKLLVFKEGEEFRYRSDECQDGYVIEEGKRLMVDEMKVDIADDLSIVVASKLGKSGEWGVYQASCNGKKLQAEKLLDGRVSSVGYLDAQTLFYSNSIGSYFYDLISQRSTKYAALGSGVEAKISSDDKYIYGVVNGKLMVVDYPAVVASGVEKHYVLDVTSDEVVFVGDEVIYLDGNMVVRVALKGSGVWEELSRIELKGFKALEILGEIRL